MLSRSSSGTEEMHEAAASFLIELRHVGLDNTATFLPPHEMDSPTMHNKAARPDTQDHAGDQTPLAPDDSTHKKVEHRIHRHSFGSHVTRCT